MGQPGERALLIAGRQCLQDLGVLGIASGLPAVRIRQLIDADVANRPVGEDPQLALQRLPGTRGNEPVIVSVGGEPGAEVARLGSAPHRGQQLRGVLAPRRPEVRDRHRQRKGLQQDPARIYVIQLLRIQAGDPGALVGLDLDQALFLQHA
jgi:hypothetical protein